MIIVISSRSGGVGKSTTAQHLAAYLAQRRGAGSVALVDLDANEVCLQWVEAGKGQRFNVLAPDDDPSGYNHLIIDTAAAPNSAEISEILESADLLIIPTTPSPFDLPPAITTAQQFEGEADILMLLTLCPPLPSKLGAVSLRAVKEAGLPVIGQTVTRRNCYMEAAIDGLHVGQLKGVSAGKAWKEWQAVGREVFRGRL